MRLSNFYLNLIVIILLSIIIRYPLTDHESGTTDSFGNHGDAVLLTNLGYLFYYFNPLSFIGAYPLSRNMGGTSFLAALSLTTGLSLEKSILVISIVCGVLGSINYSIFYRYFDKSKLMFLVSFLLISFSPLFLSYTTWNYSYRVGTFILYPLVYLSFFMLMKKFRSNFMAYFTLFCLLLFSAISFHRISVFLVHFILSIIFSHILIMFFKGKNLSRYFHYGYFSALLIFIYVYALFGSFYEAAKDIELFSLNDIPGMVIYFISFARTYSKYLGLLSVFLPLGLFFSIRKITHYRQTKYLYPLIIILFYVPFIHDVQYAGNYIFGFLALAIIFGVSEFLALIKIEKEVNPSFTLIATILICLVPQYIVVDPDSPSYKHNITNEPIINSVLYPEDYNLALYLKYQSSDSSRLLFNSGGTADEISTFSEKISYGIPITYDEKRLKNMGLVDLATGNYDYILTSDIQIDSINNIYWDVYRTEEPWDGPRTQIYLDYHTFGSGKYYVVQSNYSNSTHVSINSEVSFESLFFSSVEKDFYVVYSDYNHNMRSLNYNEI